MNRFSIITPALHKVTVTNDDGTDTGDLRTSLAAAEMIIVDTAFGKVEVTICNGAVVAQVIDCNGANVGPAIHTSLGESLSSAVWGG